MPTLAERYRRFADLEARGSSPLYEALANGVAGDRSLQALLESLPAGKQQPNLLFAAARSVTGTPSGFAEFRQAVLDNRDAVVETMHTRSTQTNEPARCAAIRPLLAELAQPLALLEVGAAAGLCLLPDQYGYDYDGVRVGAGDPLLQCAVDGAGPAVDAPIEVVWRAGIDLNPLDVNDPDDVRWLETLVWPEHTERLARLRAAIATAAVDPPRIVAGDLNERLTELAAQAPDGATLVVFHTAVLNYLVAADRDRFAAQVARLPGHWISQEGYGVLPELDLVAGVPPPAHTAAMLLSLDRRPRAYAAPHGGWLRWLPGAR